MSYNHLGLSFPCSIGYWETAKRPETSCGSQKAKGSVVSAHLDERTNDKSKPSIYSSFPGDVSYFPFWARKCGCAECIIASDKVGTNYLHTQNRYRNSQQGGCFSQNSNGHNLALQAKGRLGEDQVLNVQRRQENANGVAVWPKKDRVTTLSDKTQTRDFRTSIQNPADARTSAFYQSSARSQSATTPVVDATNSLTQLLKTDSVNKRNEAGANYWPWYGASDKVSYHNPQPDLRSIHQTSSAKLSSRDPRLRSKSENCNGSGESNSNENKNSAIYQGHVNYLPLSRSGKIFRDEHQSEDNSSKRYLEEIERSFPQGGTTTATWRNVSAMGQQPKPGQAQSVYPERRAPATEKKDDLSGDDWNVQGRWGKQPMHLTLSELSNKHGVNEKISCGTNPYSNPSLPNDKTCGTSKEKLQKGTKWTPKKLDSFDSKNKHGAGDLAPFQNGGSHRKKQKSITNKKASKNVQDAKSLEIYAREQRIRNLKTLLAKQEQALDALRFQRKQSFSDELSGSFVDITNNETPHWKSSDQEDIVEDKEESYSSTGANLVGNSLKRRWLKNWNEEDQLDDKPPEKIEKTDKTDSHGTLSEDGNQNLSNAEFTALEGLVRLSKD